MKIVRIPVPVWAGLSLFLTDIYIDSIVVLNAEIKSTSSYLV